MQMTGRQDAKDQLEAREMGFDSFQLFDEWNEDKEDVKSAYHNFSDYLHTKLRAILGK